MSIHARKPHFTGAGVHHATINGHRFHMRPLPDGALLWLNGRQPPYRLDQTAADFVTLLIDAMWRFQQGEGDESEQVRQHVVDGMLNRYRRPLALRNRVTRNRVNADLDRLSGILRGLAQGVCPAEIGITATEIQSGTWDAPARMDLAVTYRCNLECAKCYNGERSVGTELSTAQWLDIYRTLWNLGIPQVVFTGGEPTLRDDLIELIDQADEFVTGLVSNGTTLVEFAQPLKDASLDYVQVTVESHLPGIHDRMTGVTGSHERTVAGIRAALDVGLEVVTNTTLTKSNTVGFSETVCWLYEKLGIRNIACNTLICSGRGTAYRESHGLSDEELKATLVTACRQAEALGICLQWYSPTCYSTLNPMELGLGVKNCSAAAHNMMIQPDGSVLPCQSWPQSVGNILTDSWDTIWNHETSKRLREHLLAPPGCSECADFALCGGACPLDPTPRTPRNTEGAVS